MLAPWRVGGRAQIRKHGAVAERDVTMAESLAEINSDPVNVVQQHGLVVAEGGRAHPQVDHDIQHGASGAGDVLGLPWWQLGKVNTTNHPGGRGGNIGLGQTEPVAGRLDELGVGEPLQKGAAVVGVLARYDLPGALDRQGDDLHACDTSGMSAPRKPSTDGRTRRWLVIGARGMLGQDVVATLQAAGEQVRGGTSADVDVRDAAACARVVAGNDGVASYDVVVNCAAYTAVDDAESQEAAAFAVNALGAAHLAAACAASGARLIQISTDYVFDGAASEPYAEDAPLAPRSAYGRTKAAGEWAALAAHHDVLVVRTAWLYGAGGGCFPRTIARALEQRETLDVVTDQLGQPTWTVDVARVVLDLVQADAPTGIYHATASGRASWHDLARAVAVSAGADPGRVHETTSAAFVRPAPRPAYSVLGHEALTAAGVALIPDWTTRWSAAAPTLLPPPGC